MPYDFPTFDDRLKKVRDALGVVLSPADWASARAQQERPADAGAALPLGRPVQSNATSTVFESVHPPPLMDPQLRNVDASGAPVAPATPSRYTLTQQSPVRPEAEIAAARAAANPLPLAQTAQARVGAAPGAADGMADLIRQRFAQPMKTAAEVMGKSPLEQYAAQNSFRAASGNVPAGVTRQEREFKMRSAEFDTNQRGADLNAMTQAEGVLRGRDKMAMSQREAGATQGYFSGSDDAAIAIAARSGASPDALFNMAQMAEQRKHATTAEANRKPYETKFHGRDAVVSNGNVQFAEREQKNDPYSSVGKLRADLARARARGDAEEAADLEAALAMELTPILTRSQENDNLLAVMKGSPLPHQAPRSARKAEGATATPEAAPGKNGELSGIDQQALAWANANPNDPRAAQIRQRLAK